MVPWYNTANIAASSNILDALFVSSRIGNRNPNHGPSHNPNPNPGSNYGPNHKPTPTLTLKRCFLIEILLS